ncbi:hypothetical protein KIN20_027073 [Parelaphostrongylus tenuis]|uniref:EGF-like domain-containing protein n=1 Tax=Parelaphostrongylus tenuis TaxID=148309 RepID=A0AAD5QYX1_PARTN|nr:hypothetical protein KIN20_027073 [Parelaphostrongylus tenuis]
MRQAGSENLNSFQIVLAQSDGITMLTLIYDKTQSKGPMTGNFFLSNLYLSLLLSRLNSSSSISSPTTFHLLPNDLLSTQSNVGQPGKWIFRIDDVIGTCPAGREHPPLCDKDCPSGRYGFFCEGRCRCSAGFPCDTATGVCANGCAAGWTGSTCDEDVDECAAGIVSCGSNAECVNTIGAYECRCRKGYSGDGKLCSLVERCYSRFGRSCSTNASCAEYPDGPRCVCDQGYRGDGFLCLPKPHHSSVGDITELLHSEKSKDDTHSDVGDHPFVMTSWQGPLWTTHRSPVPRGYSVLHIASTSKPPLNVMKKGHPENQEEFADATTLLFLIGPAVLCAIWVILVIVVIAVCCRNKHSDRTYISTSKQFGAIWKPPSHGTAAAFGAPSNITQYSTRLRPFDVY